MLYEIKIFKKVDGASSDSEWSNAYELETEAPLDSNEFEAAATAFWLAEQGPTATSIICSRIVCSAILPVGTARTPEHLRVIGIGQRGAAPVLAGTDDQVNALPLNNVIVIAHGGTLGRQGRNSYRGMLRGPDWASNGVQPTITGEVGNNLAADLSELRTQAGPLGTPDDFKWVVVHRNKETHALTSRPVEKVTLIGIGQRTLTSRRKKKVTAGA